MKITAITVAVDYDDFLVHSLKHNRKLFDRWIVVTNKKSWSTEKLCNQNDVECIKTDVFYEGAVFNKFAGINKALELVEDDWVLFLDADIILHQTFRRVLDELGLDPGSLYGIDRLNCEGPAQYKEYLNGAGILKEYWMLHPANLTIGARLVHLYGSEGEDGRFCGWNPVGFFQLAHRSGFNWYPQDSQSADHCDLIFARYWPRWRRVFIPEMYCVHLESDHANKGVNWYGRRSQPFITDDDSMPDINWVDCVVEAWLYVERLIKKFFWGKPRY